MKNIFASDTSRLPGFLGYGLLVFVVTTGCLLGAWYQAAGSLQLERMDRFGKTIAAQIAALSIEPIMLNDRVGLAVLASRLTALPEIRGIGIFSIDDQELTRTGIINNRSLQYQYRHAIEMQDNIAGYVQVELERQAFAIPLTQHVMGSYEHFPSGHVARSHRKFGNGDNLDKNRRTRSRRERESGTA